MAEKPSSPKKAAQIPFADYLKIKEKKAKDKLKLHLPPLVLIILTIPAAYFIFMLLYFLVYIRFVAEH